VHAPAFVIPAMPASAHEYRGRGYEHVRHEQFRHHRGYHEGWRMHRDGRGERR